ncbi:hypothetical protein cyc_01365 [Cyclospora cayetanensis]|uniref:Uncharacterized protein n=1 Tax=Cyclospora cayetanensis TaxID=88456 RepID=A0A1D3CSZ9_9EIME|nr:hypothetical protein cyc_01365 [Cyclospora cayetanensis]
MARNAQRRREAPHKRCDRVKGAAEDIVDTGDPLRVIFALILVHISSREVLDLLDRGCRVDLSYKET